MKKTKPQIQFFPYLKARITSCLTPSPGCMPASITLLSSPPTTTVPVSIEAVAP